MDLINKNSSLVTRRKKKRKEDYRTLFSVYKSDKTIKDYMFYLKQFLNYVYEGEEDISQEEVFNLMKEITRDDVEDYIYYLVEEKKLKKTSVNKIISALKSLYRELEKHGFDNPVKFISLLKVSKNNFNNILKLSGSDIKKMLSLYEIVDDKSYRNFVIVNTLFYAGLRSQELLDLKFKDIIIRDGDYVLKLERTKSGREQYKPLHKKCYEHILKYKNYIKKIFQIKEDKIKDFYIFGRIIDGESVRLSYPALYSIIQEMGKLIEKDITPHNIRHAVATELSLNGVDIIEIRDFLGHANTKVTEVYISTRKILEKKALEKLPEL